MSGDPVENVLRSQNRLTRRNYLALNYCGHPPLDADQPHGTGAVGSEVGGLEVYGGEIQPGASCSAVAEKRQPRLS